MEPNYLHAACQIECADEAALQHWFLISNSQVGHELKREPD